nr:MAG TPA: hypothetical protein [Caudoviricetes sp.]
MQQIHPGVVQLTTFHNFVSVVEILPVVISLKDIVIGISLDSSVKT